MYIHDWTVDCIIKYFLVQVYMYNITFCTAYFFNDIIEAFSSMRVILFAFFNFNEI